jgi:hypothetical protein
MPATITQDGFDLDAFRKLVARFDSGHAGDVDTAVRRAVLMCAENGVGFGEAMTEAFGQTDASSTLQKENLELRAEVERRKSGGDELAEALAQAQREVAALQRREDSDGHLRSAKTLLLMLVAVIAVRAGLFIGLGEGRPPGGTYPPGPGFAPWIANTALVLSGAWLLQQWHRTEHAADGWLQLLMKWAILASGLFLAAAMFFGGAPWDASVYHRAPVPALITALLAVLLTLSKFTERLAERVPVALGSLSLRGTFAWLRGWFF